MNAVQSVRYGFAANSSSTHSIILAGDDHKIYDDLSQSFGWDFFTASSEKAKQQYLASVLMNHFEPIVGHEVSRSLILHWLNVDIDDQDACIGIDHQSVPTMPKDWEGKGIDIDFFNAYKDYLLQKNLVILGGNDNVNEVHPLTSKYEPFVLPLFYDRKDMDLVCRWDPSYHYWTLFDRLSGNKVRLFFNKDQEKKITKAHVPELVDVKITDYCESNCSFCYQGSTTKGKHANVNYLSWVFRLLRDNKVFEVALGGGEPTSHPEFIRILKMCSYNNIIPNFTTKSLDWLKDDKVREEVLPLIGSFAFSALNSHEVRELGFLLNRYNIPNHKVQIQIVDGVLSEYAFTALLRECSYHNLTLNILGFKVTGRGIDYIKSKYREKKYNWISIVKKSRKNGNFVRIGIDTEMIESYGAILSKEGVDKIFFTPGEGKFSCYIDAVTQEMGSSSYNPDDMTSFKIQEMESFFQIFQLY